MCLYVPCAFTTFLSFNFQDSVGYVHKALENGCTCTRGWHVNMAEVCVTEDNLIPQSYGDGLISTFHFPDDDADRVLFFSFVNFISVVSC